MWIGLPWALLVSAEGEALVSLQGDIVNAMDFALGALCQLLGKFFREETTGCVLEEIAEAHSDELRGIVQALDSIDWDETKDQRRLVPHYGVSESLDEIRDVFDSIESILAELSSDCATIYGDALANRMRPTYMPSVGFLIMVKVEETGERQGESFAPPSDFKFLFKQNRESAKGNPEGEYMFFKNNSTSFLDENFGDLVGAIKGLEERVQEELQATMLVQREHLIEACNQCAKLDVLVAFASCAVDFNYVKPDLTTNGQIKILQGRHPLVEHNTPEEYIPNDINLTAGNLMVVRHSLGSIFLIMPTELPLR